MRLSGNILVKSHIRKTKFNNVFDIRKDYSLIVQNMRKIFLLGFSIQRLWKKSLEISRNFSIGPLFLKYDWAIPPVSFWVIYIFVIFILGIVN